MDSIKRFFNDSTVVGYTQWIIRWRWLVIATTLAATFAVASGGRFLEFSTDYRIFFGDDNPQLLAYEELRNTYSKDDNVIFVLKPGEGQTFTPEFLTAVRKLT
ncbi:MAG: RND family transporter, partial [SAR324 cluster bacterium]|nr:RND family transporter [SAR324 cluster bacterium]